MWGWYLQNCLRVSVSLSVALWSIQSHIIKSWLNLHRKKKLHTSIPTCYFPVEILPVSIWKCFICYWFTQSPLSYFFCLFFFLSSFFLQVENDNHFIPCQISWKHYWGIHFPRIKSLLYFPISACKESRWGKSLATHLEFQVVNTRSLTPTSNSTTDSGAECAILSR